MSNITHILSSPLTRTLETALFSFTPLLSSGLKIVAWDELRESGKFRCNEGKLLSDLREELEGKPVELGLLKEGWENMDGLEKGESKNRGNRVRSQLRRLGEECLKKRGVWKGMNVGWSWDEGRGRTKDVGILVIGHAGFWREVTKGMTETLSWENGEC